MGIKKDPYEQSLKLEKNSAYLGSDDDDGPGDFGPEDFEGIETLFSKQSLEQRKLRVHKARERLRRKKLQRM